MSARLIWAAPAKINLWLRVLGRRADGYHELDTAFAFLDWADALAFAPAERLQVHCNVPALSGEENLVYRVLAAFARELGIVPRLRVDIEKRLPVRAGVGGGSSDAATALLAANLLWRAHWPRARLIAFAKDFGADIPIFLFGRAARAQGIGEKLAPITLPRAWVAVALPDCEPLSTRAVFAEWDAGVRTPRLQPSQATDSLAALGANELEAAACAMRPALGALLAFARAHGLRAWMTGSGFAIVSWARTRAEAEKAAQVLMQQATFVRVARVAAVHPLGERAIGA